MKEINKKEIEQKIRSEYESAIDFCRGDFGRYYVMMVNVFTGNIWSDLFLNSEAGIPYRNFYALRHTHATMLFTLGVHPKIVQERLGHSSIKVTVDTYSHIVPGIQRLAVEELEKI